MHLRKTIWPFLFISFIYSTAGAVSHSCPTGEQGCVAQSNPFQVFPWMANTLPSVSAGLNGQGIPTNWMNLQWMMMANHFIRR